MNARALNAAASASLIALIALCLSWELWLAPLRPSGSWLVLKTLPLLAPLFGVLRGNRYTFKWSSMLILMYFVEGAVRSYTDSGMSARLAITETVLALVFFAATILYVRTARTNST